MAFTLQDLEALESLIKTGAKRIEYGDKVMEAQSLTDMLRLRDLMQQELGIIKPTQKRKLISYNKGVYPDDSQR